MPLVGVGRGGGPPPPLPNGSHQTSRGTKRTIYKTDRTSAWIIHHESRAEKLLEDFEEFELDLELEEILAKVKADCVLDQGVTQFAQQLKQGEEEKRVAQIQRETQVQQQWTPGHYPQHTCAWFVEGLDFCCPYWRYRFKRPLTPPSAPPPSPEPCRTAKKKKLRKF